MYKRTFVYVVSSSRTVIYGFLFQDCTRWALSYSTDVSKICSRLLGVYPCRGYGIIKYREHCSVRTSPQRTWRSCNPGI
ncbi:hypothetical protein GDO81_028723 [Engystomops pustulosus]|uniref:Secreted protein n=1 Tax=Engystomops pustulosus TaxID=76066 RepID=A0AAV6YEB2_ENGPU|nr:hypothetical protein GDO81_028723 [Engystomops pustulosus]